MTVIHFIILCVIGALVIEVCDRARIRALMDRNVTDLMLAHDTRHAQRHTEQSNNDNQKQNSVHRFISFGRI
jgi:hypothetical protein